MKPIEDVEGALRALANDPSLSRRHQSLHELADALTNEDGFLWAKVDLYEAFGEDSITIVGEPKRNERLGLAELIRNVCILLPLLITWLGITFAILAYERLLSNPRPGEAQLLEAPFVELWTEGFGGRTVLTFSVIGILDVTAIAIVIGLSVWASWLQRKLNVDTEREREDKWNELRSALTDAAVVLASRAYDAPVRFTEELSRLWSSYDKLAVQISQASKDFAVSVRQSDGYTRQLEEATSALGAASGSVDTHTAALVQTIDGLRSDITALMQRAEAVGAEVATLSARQHEAISELSLGLDANRAAANVLAASAEHIPVNVQKVGEALVSGIRDELADRHETAKQLTAASERAAGLAQALTVAADGFASSAVELRGAASAMPGEMTAASRALAALLERSTEAIDVLPAKLIEGLVPLGAVDAQLRTINESQEQIDRRAALTGKQLEAIHSALEGGLTQLSESVAVLASRGVPAPPELEAAAASLQTAAQACEYIATNSRSARATNEVVTFGDLPTRSAPAEDVADGSFIRRINPLVPVGAIVTVITWAILWWG